MKNNIIKSGFSEEEKKRKKGIRAVDLIAYLLCLVLSFGIWVYVVSLESENYEYTFKQIVVQPDGVNDLKSHNLSIITGYDTEISVTVTGSRREISKYTADDIFAHVDVSNITEADRYALDVIVDLPDEIKLVSAEPSKINVMVDETASVEVDLEVILLYGAKEYYTVHEAEPSVERILVTGPKSLLNTISRAQVTYDLGDVTTSVNFNAPIVLLDSDDNEISNPYIKTNVNEVKVRVPVTMKKTLPLVAEYTASDLDKYEYFIKLFVNENDQTVVVVGDPDIISNMESVKINVGDITNYTDGEFTVADMNLDAGVTLFDESITSVKCTVDKKLIAG